MNRPQWLKETRFPHTSCCFLSSLDVYLNIRRKICHATWSWFKCVFIRMRWPFPAFQIWKDLTHPCQSWMNGWGKWFTSPFYPSLSSTFKFKKLKLCRNPTLMTICIAWAEWRSLFGVIKEKKNIQWGSIVKIFTIGDKCRWNLKIFKKFESWKPFRGVL